MSLEAGAQDRLIGVYDNPEQVDSLAWNALLEAQSAPTPFMRHEYLLALHESASAVPDTGWALQLLCLEHGDMLQAACPVYVKSHSYGEYVFDWAWADAYERAGGRYYPKLQSAVPFTPITGRRLLVGPNAPAGAAEVLAAAMVRLAEQLEVSSLHVTFPTEPEWRTLGEHGWLMRTGYQYHWENRGYRTFDDFLGDLSSRKRKAIRKERREVAESGLTIRRLTGAALEERHWDAFFHFYTDTSDRKWGSPYLNRRFFALLGERLAERILLVVPTFESRLYAMDDAARTPEAVLGLARRCEREVLGISGSPRPVSSARCGRAGGAG